MIPFTQILFRFLYKFGVYSLSSYYIFNTCFLLSNPTKGQVTYGDATIDISDHVLTVEQKTEKAAISWDHFSIEKNEVTQFIQPHQDSVIFNRVTKIAPSMIDGVLKANGKVVLVNKEGLFVGKEGMISTKGFLATTLINLSPEAFFNTSTLYLSDHSEGVIENCGLIETDGHTISLIAREVSNRGKIDAGQGNVTLLGAQEVLLCENNEKALIRFPTTGRVCNEGIIKAAQIEIMAAGGNMYSTAISCQGVLEAKSLVSNAGHILLKAERGAIDLDGSLLCSEENDKIGGKIFLIGEEISLTNTTMIDASGNHTGGQVLVGGCYRGKENPDFPHAKKVLVEKEVLVKASGKKMGNGGQVILWADEEMDFNGSINASGHIDGGLVEISSLQAFYYRPKMITVSGINGRNGQLLLDPCDINITATSPSAPSFTNPYSPLTSTANLFVGDLTSALANAEVTIISSNSSHGKGDISVLTPISWTASAAGSKLSLQAYRNININEPITASAGRIFVGFPGPEIELTSSNGSIFIDADVTSKGGNGLKGPDGKPATTNIDGGPGYVGGVGGDISITATKGDIQVNDAIISSTGGNGGAGGAGAATIPAGKGGNAAGGASAGMVELRAPLGNMHITSLSEILSLGGNAGRGGDAGDDYTQSGNGGNGGVANEVILSSQSPLLCNGTVKSVGGIGGDGGNSEPPGPLPSGDPGYKGNGGNASQVTIISSSSSIAINNAIASTGGAPGALGKGTPVAGADRPITLTAGTDIDVQTGASISSSDSISFDIGNNGAGVLTLLSSLSPTGTLTAIGHGSNDRFKLGAGVSFLGTIDAGGGNQNALDYADYTSDITVDLTANSATNINSIANIQKVIASKGKNSLSGKSGENNFFEFQTSPSALSTVNGGDILASQNQLIFNTSTGNDIQLSGSNSGSVNGVLTFSNINYLQGGDGSDSLRGTNIDNTWNITNNNAGNLSSLSFAKVDSLVGGSEKDTFVLSDQKGISNLIDGGSSTGPNTLDYSAYTSYVSVNIPAKQATNIGSIERIQQVIYPTLQIPIEERIINSQFALTYNIENWKDFGNFARYRNLALKVLIPFDGFFYLDQEELIYDSFVEQD